MLLVANWPVGGRLLTIPIIAAMAAAAFRLTLASERPMPRVGPDRGIARAAWNFFEARILTLT